VFLDRWTRLSSLEHAIIIMLQAGVAAVLFLMAITALLLGNDIDQTPWRGRQAAFATCVLAYAVAFAMVTPVELTRESGIEVTVKQQPAQIAEKSWLVCSAT
jgi:hypothetical protein